MYGGGQENGARSGTTNVPGVVGFGEACRLCAEHLIDESARIRALRDTFEADLRERMPNLQINASGADRLPNTSSLTFPGTDADALLLNLPDVMLGTGSACTSGAMEPSHVLTAMGISRADASSTVRVSLGRFTQSEDMAFAVDQIAEVFGMMTSASSSSRFV
jgi:cysteine desulfurase